MRVAGSSPVVRSSVFPSSEALFRVYLFGISDSNLGTIDGPGLQVTPLTCVTIASGRTQWPHLELFTTLSPRETSLVSSVADRFCGTGPSSRGGRTSIRDVAYR